MEKSLLESLLDSVKSLLNLDVGSAYSDSNVQLALTIMLVDLALVDNDFDDEEYRAIYHVLIEKLGVESAEAHELINEAKGLIKDGKEDIESYSTFLMKRLSEVEREKVMIDFIEIMGADSTIHPFEVDLKARYEQLLGLK